VYNFSLGSLFLVPEEDSSSNEDIFTLHCLQAQVRLRSSYKNLARLLGIKSGGKGSLTAGILFPGGLI
jgi:hypothetical protein